MIRRRELIPALLVVCGVALGVEGVVARHGGGTPTHEGFGALPVVSSPTPRSRPAPRAGDEAPRGDVGVHSALPEDLPRARSGARPKWIRVRAIGVGARIVPVGVTGTTTEIPEDVDHVGWYRFGPVPGRSGSAVLVGHVDSRSQGHGAFFHLGDLSPGDDVSVGFSDRSVVRFEVRARRSYLKAHLPQEVFSRTGPTVLALITCGGSFETATLSYSDNIVVYAVPQTASGAGST